MSRRVHNSFIKAESGATAIEYSLVAALIAVAVIAAVAATGSATGLMFNEVAERTVKALSQSGI